LARATAPAKSASHEAASLAQEDSMKRIALFATLLLATALPLRAQNPQTKFIAETLVVEAEGTYEADPDLATLTFNISAQENELKKAYDKASASMRKIVELANRNGLKKEEIETGVLTITPFYEGDRKKRAKSYRVQGQIKLKVKDFAKLGALMDESVQDEITDFRSLTYSLVDEEAAKQKAVADAMKRAIGRANAALEQKGQKAGALRFANLDVKELVGLEHVEFFPFLKEGLVLHAKLSTPPPPPPTAHPEKITVSATVQCAFQIL
jgi:uncharacterized protein